MLGAKHQFQIRKQGLETERRLQWKDFNPSGAPDPLHPLKLFEDIFLFIYCDFLECPLLCFNWIFKRGLRSPTLEEEEGEGVISTQSR